MGFVYLNKIFSIEEVFSLLKTNHENKIKGNAKEIKIFDGFAYQEGWDLETFEHENLETYKRYEGINTELNSQEYRQAPYFKKLQKFAEIYKKYYPDDAVDLDKKIEEIAKNGTQSGQYTYANFLLDLNKKQVPKFGVDAADSSKTELKSILVVGQEDNIAKEGDFGVKNNETYKYTNGEWKRIETE